MMEAFMHFAFFLVLFSFFPLLSSEFQKSPGMILVVTLVLQLCREMLCYNG